MIKCWANLERFASLEVEVVTKFSDMLSSNA